MNLNSENLAPFLYYYYCAEGADAWDFNWRADKIVKKLSCLTHETGCFSYDQDTIIIEEKGFDFFSLDTKNICIFPFKYSNTTYNACTRNGGSTSKGLGFWCATSVDVNQNWQTYGFCNDLCPLEGMYF